MATRTEHRIPAAGGEELAATVYEPVGSAGPLAVVLAAGFSLTRRDGLGGFGDAFAEAGITAVTFDYRHFGESGGQPRQKFSAGEQQADLTAALGYARGLPAVTRVAAWGYSFGGGHATTLAARPDSRIDALLLLCPFLDGLRRALGTPPATTAWILPRAIASAAGRRVTVPVTAPSGTKAAMNWNGESDGFAAAIGPGSAWQNEITPEVFLTVASFRPYRKARRVTAPAFVGLGERDISVSATAVRAFAENAPKAELHTYDVDHFEPFGAHWASKIAADQIDFLGRSGLLA